MVHEFEPPLYTFSLDHRGTFGTQFTDNSQFEVSGLVTYPVWNTGFVLCGVANVASF